MEKAPHFAVVDVETTGGKPEYARIIEIGIVLVDDWKITDSFSSFVHTDGELSPFIQNLTGITPQKLKNAPEFEQIAEKVDALLDGRIFVAHNVASDYGVLEAEMKRAGLDFSPERLCTVKLSRRVFPGLAKYSLHELVAELGLPDFDQHHALNDAMAAARVLIHANESGGSAQIEELLRGGKKPLFYPKNWTEERVMQISRHPGILYFMGKSGVLYATAARNLRSRALELLSNTRRSPLKGLTDGIWDIRVKELGSEILSKLYLESELAKTRFPCNAVVRKLPDVGAPLPDLAMFLPGRSHGECGVVIVQGGKVCGFTFVREECEVRLFDILENLIPFEQTENLVPILRQALLRRGVRVQFLP